MDDHTISIISLIVSIAAFGFGGYSLWLTRKDRKVKHELLKDYERAKPLLETNFNEFFSTKLTEPEDCKNLLLFLEDHEINFSNKVLKTEYETLLKGLYGLANTPKTITDRNDVGQEFFKRNDYAFSTEYRKEIENWRIGWDKFLRKVRIETAPKEG